MLPHSIPSPDLVALLAAATPESSPALPEQFGLAGLVVVPLVSALVWYARRNDARWEQQLKRESDRADRYEERFNDLQAKVLPVLHAAVDTNGEVVGFLRELGRGARNGRG